MALINWGNILGGVLVSFDPPADHPSWSRSQPWVRGMDINAGYGQLRERALQG